MKTKAMRKTLHLSPLVPQGRHQEHLSNWGKGGDMNSVMVFELTLLLEVTVSIQFSSFYMYNTNLQQISSRGTLQKK